MGFENANLYDVQVAIDSYRAKNDKHDEIDIWSDARNYEYGTKKFSSREQAIAWLASQEVDTDKVRNYIESVRKKDQNSSLEPYFIAFDRYYGEKSQTQKSTKGAVAGVKDSIKIHETNTSVTAETLTEDIFLAAKTYNEVFLQKHGKTVTNLQEGLIIHGYYYGDTTGTFDEKTHQALILFHKGNAMKHNASKLTEASLSKLFDPQIQAHIETSRQELSDWAQEKRDGWSREALASDEKIVIPEHTPKKIIDACAAVSKNELAKIGKTIQDLQSELKKINMYRAEVTGVFDEETYLAIVEFQSGFSHIETNGKATQETLKLLFKENTITDSNSRESSADKPETVVQKTPEKKEKTLAEYQAYAMQELKKYDKNILELQALLVQNNYIDPEFMDETFNAETLAAVEKFQTDNGLTPDGLVGPKTIGKIFPPQTPTVEDETGTIDDTKKETQAPEVNEESSFIDLGAFAEKNLEAIGKNILYMQAVLVREGLLSAEHLRGDFDEATLVAVRKYQEKYEIEANGHVDNKMLDTMFPYERTLSFDEYKAHTLAELQNNEQPKTIADLKTALKNMGYFSGTIDENFTREVLQALVELQNDMENTLEKNGIMGRDTFEVLFMK